MSYIGVVIVLLEFDLIRESSFWSNNFLKIVRIQRISIAEILSAIQREKVSSGLEWCGLITNISINCILKDQLITVAHYPILTVNNHKIMCTPLNVQTGMRTGTVNFFLLSMGTHEQLLYIFFFWVITVRFIFNKLRFKHFGLTALI